MLHHCLSFIAVVSTLSRSQVSASRGSCYSSYNGTKEKSYSCEDGYYCCNIYSDKCCPEAGNNEFYDWILVISSIAVLLFITVMSCYWCSCCPAYKRRMNATASPVIQPSNTTSTRATGHRPYLRQEECQQGAPYLVQCGSSRGQMPPRLGELDRHDQTLVPTYSAQPSAPPYSRHSVPNHSQSESPYRILQPPGDIYVPLAPPVYPDEPPPRYTP